ncbi:MAG: hypothetical protein ACKV22_01625 [Bryobacteraceae bacterium]
MIGLRTALGLFGVLAVLAAIFLSGKMRTIVWIVLAGLAIKTLIASKKRALDKDEPSRN